MPARIPPDRHRTVVSALREAARVGVKHFFIEDESPASIEQIPQSLRYLESLAW